MQLTHDFRLAVPVDTAWQAFNDLGVIAPCFPGATLHRFDGTEFSGSIKIKFGPFALFYYGSGRVIERDAEARRLVVEASGKERRTSGTGQATVTASFTGDDEQTEVHVVTDLGLTGRPAQLGRGVISDVSDRLLDQFLACLSERFAAGLEFGPTAPGSLASGEGEPTVELGTVPEELDGELDQNLLTDPQFEEEPVSTSSASSSAEFRGVAGNTAPASPFARPAPSGPAAPRRSAGYVPPEDLSKPDFEVFQAVVPPLAKRYGPALALAAVLAAITVVVYRKARSS